jgi:hypothetical protein
VAAGPSSAPAPNGCTSGGRTLGGFHVDGDPGAEHVEAAIDVTPFVPLRFVLTPPQWQQSTRLTIGTPGVWGSNLHTFRPLHTPH